MFQRILIQFAVVTCLTAPVTAQDQVLPVLMDTQPGQQISMDQLVADMDQVQVLFLGETHDNDAGHKFQMELIRKLAEQNFNLVVSMEQFERDVQGAVDDYLAGRIDEAQFLAVARPWKNYQEHYRPIVEFAREHHIPILASNAPRRLATDVSMGRTVKLADQVFLPRSTSAPENAYWQNFQETMKGHGGTGDGKQLKNFYAAQCLKDDAMAESITDYLAANAHRSTLVVHLCGHFHSDYGLGTAARVVQRRPLTRIAVSTMETIPEDGKMEMDDARNRAHYVLWTPKNNSPPSTAGDNPE